MRKMKMMEKKLRKANPDQLNKYIFEFFQFKIVLRFVNHINTYWVHVTLQ